MGRIRDKYTKSMSLKKPRAPRAYLEQEGKMRAHSSIPEALTLRIEKIHLRFRKLEIFSNIWENEHFRDRGQSGKDFVRFSLTCFEGMPWRMELAENDYFVGQRNREA